MSLVALLQIQLNIGCKLCYENISDILYSLDKTFLSASARYCQYKNKEQYLVYQRNLVHGILSFYKHKLCVLKCYYSLQSGACFLKYILKQYNHLLMSLVYLGKNTQMSIKDGLCLHNFCICFIRHDVNQSLQTSVVCQSCVHFLWELLAQISRYRLGEFTQLNKWCVNWNVLSQLVTF